MLGVGLSCNDPIDRLTTAACDTLHASDKDPLSLCDIEKIVDQFHHVDLKLYLDLNHYFTNVVPSSPSSLSHFKLFYSDPLPLDHLSHVHFLGFTTKYLLLVGLRSPYTPWSPIVSTSCACQS